jgi:hypothetical protein
MALFQEKKVAEINQQAELKLTPQQEQLYQVLKQIEKGKENFEPSNDGLEALKEFQSIVRCLKKAMSCNYIGKVEFCESYQENSYGMILYAMVISGLTFDGMEVLNNPQKLIIDNNSQANIDMSTRNITATNYIEGDLNGGNIAGRDINIQNNQGIGKDELKEVLSQLQALISSSPLSEAAKQKALGKTNEIAEATHKPEAEQKNIIQKTLSYFDGLADSLESVPDKAVKLGELAAKIAF